MPDRRTEIAQLAATVIANQGIEGASLRAIAARMGVTIGTLTHHFRDRDDLLRTTFEVTVRGMRERAVHAAAGRPGSDVLHALLREGLATGPRGRIDTAVWLAFSQSAVTNADHARLCAQLYAEWEAAVAEALTQLGVPDPHDGARVLTAATDGIALRALAAPGLTDADQERLLAAAIAAVVAAP